VVKIQIERQKAPYNMVSRPRAAVKRLPWSKEKDENLFGCMMEEKKDWNWISSNSRGRIPGVIF
jgi:hypothetical protein